MARAKPFVNVFAKKAKTTVERSHWDEAAHFAGKLYHLAKIAQAYHNGEVFVDVIPQPVASELLRCAVRFNDAESAAIAISQHRYEEKVALQKKVKRGKAKS